MGVSLSPPSVPSHHHHQLHQHVIGGAACHLPEEAGRGQSTRGRVPSPQEALLGAPGLPDYNTHPGWFCPQGHTALASWTSRSAQGQQCPARCSGFSFRCSFARGPRPEGSRLVLQTSIECLLHAGRCVGHWGHKSGSPCPSGFCYSLGETFIHSFIHLFLK